MSIRRQTSTLTGTVIVGWALALAACGGGSSKASPYPDAGNGLPGTGGTGTAGGTGGAAVVAMGSPAQQCNQLAGVICTRGSQCPGLTFPAVNVCQSTLSTQFNCDQASTGDFASCIADTNVVSCASLFPSGGFSPPGACDAPLNAIPLSDPQSKCYDLVDQICARIFQCNGVNSPTQTDVTNCENSLVSDPQTTLPCPIATGVGAGYASCLASVPTLACPSSADGGAAAADGGMASMMSSCTSAPITFLTL